MRKNIGIIFAMILVLYPRVSKADLDLASIVQDTLSTVQENVNKIVKQYTGLEINLQELAKNRDALKGLKDQALQLAKDQAAAFVCNIKVSDLNLKGVKDKIKGNQSTAELKAAVHEEYVKKGKVLDDIKQAEEQVEKNNQLMAENIAATFARSLVNRKKIMEEAKTLENEESNALSDLPSIIERYKTINARANSRWRTILEASVSFEQQLAQDDIMQMKLLDEETALETLKQAQEQAEATRRASEKRRAEKQKKSISLGEIYGAGSKSLDALSRGDYAGAFGAAVSGYTSYYGHDCPEGDKECISTAEKLNRISTGAYATQNAYKDAELGDYKGALSDLAYGARRAGTEGMQQYGTAVDALLRGDYVTAASYGLASSNYYGNGQCIKGNNVVACDDGIYDLFNGKVVVCKDRKCVEQDAPKDDNNKGSDKETEDKEQ